MWWIIKWIVCWVIENYLQNSAYLLEACQKANGIEPIRLTVSSMSCDLLMVIAYYEDKWTHLSNWSLSTHFSSFLESWGHYLSTLDRQQWQPGEQRACMTRHRWLFYSDEYIYSHFQRSQSSSCMVCSHPKHSPRDISLLPDYIILR